MGLNPELKWVFIKERWEGHPEWIVDARESVFQLWRSQYSRIAIPEPDNVPEAELYIDSNM